MTEQNASVRNTYELASARTDKANEFDVTISRRAADETTVVGKVTVVTTSVPNDYYQMPAASGAGFKRR